MREKVFGIIIVLFLLASLAPMGYEIANSGRLQSNREFELVHNFPTDYNFYLSRIRQGIEGRVTVREQYTSEPHQGSFIHIFYLVLGWLGAWVRVPWHRAADVYHVARIVFGGLLLVLIAEFCKKMFNEQNLSSSGLTRGSSFLWKMDSRLRGNDGLSILAFLLSVTASTWPKLLSLVGDQIVPATMSNVAGWRFGGYMPWWSVTDSLQRITFIPHLLVGQALIIFLIMALSDAETMKKPGNWVFLGVIAFIEGIIFPPGLLFIVVTVGVLIVIEVLASQEQVLRGWRAFRSFCIQLIVPRAVALGLALPSLVYLSLMTSFYPWKRLAEFDIIKPLPFDYVEYLKAVGPMLPLGIIGLIIAHKYKERRLFPAVAWVTAWALLLFIFKFIPQQSPLRFSEMIPHVPLGVLAAYLFAEIRSTKHEIRNNTKIQIFKIPNVLNLEFSISNLFRISNFEFRILLMRSSRLVGVGILSVLIFTGLGVMYSSWLWQKDFIDHKMRATYPLVPTGSYVMYPLKDFIAAMRFIQDATGDRQTVILSETTAGNYIPVYSGNTVYVGHANTVKAEEKEVKVKEFFSGRMKPDEAKTWMTRENLHWIFYGPQEKEDGGVGNLSKIYPFLTETYKNSFVTVYKRQ
ncbi:hypothetical protein HY949_03775 [Candidatus Gottesmanbacteria bacterium]|nr:hypothetical protein [Candidatus Gottesmanbacteria bacterium]